VHGQSASRVWINTGWVSKVVMAISAALPLFLVGQLGNMGAFGFAQQTGIQRKLPLSNNVQPRTKELCKFDVGRRRGHFDKDGNLGLSYAHLNHYDEAIDAWLPVDHPDRRPSSLAATRPPFRRQNRGTLS